MTDKDWPQFPGEFPGEFPEDESTESTGHLPRPKVNLPPAPADPLGFPGEQPPAGFPGEFPGEQPPAPAPATPEEPALPTPISDAVPEGSDYWKQLAEKAEAKAAAAEAAGNHLPGTPAPQFSAPGAPSNSNMMPPGDWGAPAPAANNTNPYESTSSEDEFPGQSNASSGGGGVDGLGIFALLSAFCCGFISIPLGFFALMSAKKNGRGKGLPIAAIVLGFINLLLAAGLAYLVFWSLGEAEAACKVENPTAEEVQLCETWHEFEDAKKEAQGENALSIVTLR